jgi:hypothetical protein
MLRQQRCIGHKSQPASLLTRLGAHHPVLTLSLASSAVACASASRRSVSVTRDCCLAVLFIRLSSCWRCSSSGACRSMVGSHVDVR